ncbi:MAG: molybdate ABC transporter permease subunit [Armatimonadetes bacterium]|nr:molybdate ABC transporter permease subunit [Armatimonadota bacterium]
MSWQPLYLSLKVSLAATAAVLLVGLPLAVLFARGRFPGKAVVETLVMLPLVLPPSVVGYYLLLFLGRHGPVEGLLGARLLLTWGAAVIAAGVVSLPLMVTPSKAAIESVDPVLEKAARTLGASEWQVLRRVTLPLARRGILAGLVLAFARAIGEFGATLMVAGNIAGRTQTLPLAIYDAVQMNNLRAANVMVGLMTLIGLGALIAAGRVQRGKQG